MARNNTKIRTATLIQVNTVPAATVVGPGVGDVWTPQDDCYVVGLWLSTQIGVSGTPLAAQSSSWVEISRAAVMNADGSLLRLQFAKAEDAGAVIPASGSNWKEGQLIFPTGYFVELDEGEDINLLYEFGNGSNADRIIQALATIYWVLKKA